MVKNLQDIVGEVEKKLSPSKYGFKKALSTNADKHNATFSIDGLDESEEYDCLYYNLKGKQLLEDKGVNTTLICGKDESEFWKNHCFLRSDEGIIIDFTPIYPTLGAKHTGETSLGNDDIKDYMRPHSVTLNNMLPLHLHQKSRSLLRIGIGQTKNIGPVKIREPHTQIYMDLLRYNPKTGKYVKKEEIILYHTGKKIGSDMKNLKSLIDNDVLSLDNGWNKPSEILKIESYIDHYVMNFLRRIL